MYIGSNIFVIPDFHLQFNTRLMMFVVLLMGLAILSAIKYHSSFSRLISFLFKCFSRRKESLDYASGMAYNYYYGYLRLILPTTGSLNKGLLEKIENFEDIHSISIPVHKLFILIPASSYIPTDLKEASYRYMESTTNLEDEIRDRAGVKIRSYHNTVYKIYPGGRRANVTPVYVVVEGATPLLTFFEVQKHLPHREENIVKKFYEKLKELIDNDPECADLCELIYYKDYNSDGTKVNVANVILKRIFDIQNNYK